MLSKKKKIFILSGMLVLLVATAIVNVILNNTLPVDKDDDTGAGNFFTNFRAERTNTRNQVILNYQAIINNAASSDTEVATAIAARDAEIAMASKEVALEGIIMGKGYDECVVIIGASVNVYVKTESVLDAQEVAQILSSVIEQTGKAATSINLIPV